MRVSVVTRITALKTISDMPKQASPETISASQGRQMRCCGMSPRKAYTRTFTSKALHALRIFDSVHLLNRREASKVDAGHQAASSFADRRKGALGLCRFALLCHDYPKAILDESGKGSTFRGRLALGAIEKVCRQTDGGSSRHMSRHIHKSSKCQNSSRCQWLAREYARRPRFGCSAPKCARVGAPDISLPRIATAEKQPVCSAPWHCCGAPGPYIFAATTCSPAVWGAATISAFGGLCGGAQDRHARRQIRSRQKPCFRHRLPGAGAALPDAEGARSPRRPQYRGLCHGLSRLTARYARPTVLARATSSRSLRRALPGRYQRGYRRHRALGHAAGGV